MRLIDADRALEIVRDQRRAHPNAYHLTNYAELILMEAPTIEAEPVQHGKWIKNDDSWWCSECETENCYAYFEEVKRFTDLYCPNCGARMDGE